MAANERLTLEISTKATGKEQVGQLTAEINRLNAATEQAGRTGLSNIRNISEGFAHTVPQVAAASAAVRTFEGTLPIRAVERFLTTTLQLGPVLQKAFPLVGAIAFAGVLVEAGKKAYELAEKFDPLKHAEDRAIESAKALNGEIAKLGKQLQDLKYEGFENALGKSAAAAIQASDLVQKVVSDKVQVGLLQSLIASDQQKVQAGTTRRFIGLNPDRTPRFESSLSRDAQAAQKDIGTVQEQLRAAQLQQQLDEANAAKLSAGSSQAQQDQNGQASKDAESAAREATERLRRQDDEGLARLKATHELTIGEIIRYWEKRRAAESDNVDREREITDKLGNLYQEREKAIEAVARRGQEVEEEQAKKAEKLQSFLSNMAVEAETIANSIATHINDAAAKLDNLKTRGAEQSTLGRLNLQRLGVQRAGLLSPNADRVAARIAEYQQIRNIDNAEADARIRAETEILNRLRSLGEEHADQVEEQENKISEIKAQAAEKDYENQTRLLEEIHNQRERELQSFRNEVGGLFDAVTSRSIPQFVKGQVLGIGKTITENLAAEFLKPQLDKLIPHSSGTLGKILQGTPFGPDPLKGATEANTVATAENTAAVTRLTSLSPSGGGGGLVSGGAGISGALAGSSSAAAGGIPADWTALPGAGGVGWGSGQPVKGSLGTLGKAVGIGAAVAGGGLAAFQDFRRGGAGGALEGVGAIAGVASTVLPLLSKTLSAAGPIGAIAGIGLSLLGSFFNSKQRRENEINKELSQNQYIAPQALNVSQDGSGNYVDFDARGGLRTSNFRAVPTVSQGFVWEQTHGLFGGPPSFYDVPGNTTSPYSPWPNGAAPQTVNIYQPGSINAIDTQSFHDAMQRNAGSVADAAATALQNQHSRFTSALQYATSN
jgi:hypothetical protein